MEPYWVIINFLVPHFYGSLPTYQFTNQVCLSLQCIKSFVT
jgi:hypothetical protein